MKNSEINEKYDYIKYDVEAMCIDNDNNNFKSEKSKNYIKENIVKESILNGEYTQAKEQARRYQLDYDLLKRA